MKEGEGMIMGEHGKQEELEKGSKDIILTITLKVDT